MTHVQTDRAPQPKHRTSSQPRHTHHQLHHALNRTPAVVLFLKRSYMLPSHQQTTSNAWNQCQNSHQWSRSWILVPCQLAFRLHPKLQGHFSMLHLWKAPLQKTAEDLLSKSPSIQKVWTNRLQKVNRRMMNQPASQWLIVLPDGQRKQNRHQIHPKHHCLLEWLLGNRRFHRLQRVKLLLKRLYTLQRVRLMVRRSHRVNHLLRRCNNHPDRCVLQSASQTLWKVFPIPQYRTHLLRLQLPPLLLGMWTRPPSLCLPGWPSGRRRLQRHLLRKNLQHTLL